MSGWRSRSLILVGFFISLETLINLDVLLPIYINSLDGSMLLIGGLYSLNGLIRLLIRIPSGSISDKFGRKPFIIIGGFLKSFGAFILSTSIKIGQVTSALIFRSSGLGVEEPAYLAMITEKTEIAQLGLTFGLLLTIQRIPKVVGPMLTGVVAEVYNIKVAFFLNSILCLVAAISIYFLLKEKSRSSTELISFDLRTLKGFNFNLILFYTAFLFHFMARVSFVPFFTVYVKEQGLSLYEIGFIMSIGQFVGLFSRVASGWFTDKIGGKKVLLYTGIVRMLTFFGVPFTYGFYQIALVFLPYYGSMAAPPRNTMLSKISDKSNYGKVFGLMATINDLGDILGALLMGFIAQKLSLKFAFWGMMLLEAIFFISLFKVKE